MLALRYLAGQPASPAAELEVQKFPESLPKSETSAGLKLTSDFGESGAWIERQKWGRKRKRFCR